MAALNWSPGGCCCILTGPWDFYQDGWDTNTVEPPGTAGTEFLSRTASIYTQDDPPENLVFDFDSYDEWFVTIASDEGSGGFNFQHKSVAGSVVALGLEDEQVYYACLDNGYHFNKRTLRFVNGPMNLAEVDTATDIEFDWASGAIYFQTLGTERDYTEIELARTNVAETWEDYGVPEGATVFQVELVSLRRGVAVTDKLVSHSLKIRFVDSANDPILEGDLLNINLPTVNTALSLLMGTEGLQATIEPLGLPYNTEIKLEIEYGLTLNDEAAGDPNERATIDDIFLRIYHSGTGMYGTISIDALNKDFLFVVTDADWFDVQWADVFGDIHESAEDIIPISIGINSTRLGEASSTDGVNPNLTDFSIACVWSGGVIKWRFFGEQVTRWEITEEGSIDYIKVDAIFALYEETFGPFLDNHGNELDDRQNPRYTYDRTGEDGGFWESQDTPYSDRMEFLDYARPIWLAGQANVGVGIHYPHLLLLPQTREEMTGPEDIVSEVHAGPIEWDVYHRPKIAGDVIWDKTVVDVMPDATIRTRVDDFDASPNHHVAVVTFSYLDEFTHDPADPGPPNFPAYWFHNRGKMYTTLILDDHKIEKVVFDKDFNLDLDEFDPDYGIVTWYEDERAYYPRWINPRMLETTEPSQGGGQRCVVFSRVPFDPTEATTDYGGTSDLEKWKLTCYVLGTSGLVDHTYETAWGNDGQATGTITLTTTTTNAVFDIRAVAGGDADFSDANGAMTITIEQSTIEDTVYDPNSPNELIVKIDIAGGNNTVQDLCDVINDAGDFWVNGGPSNGSNIIETSDTGSGTLAGGTDNVTTIAEPVVNQSSSRYYYLMNFPMKVRQLVGNRWHTLFTGSGDFTLPSCWMITHNGEIQNPLGSGIDRTRRETVVTGQSPFGATFDSIKNAHRIPLYPAKTEI
jgi:hypothetical protein